MKTLLYLASGKYYPEYENLPFDQLIFVDKSRSCSASYPEIHPRIRFICKDALLAIDDLMKEQVKIDCLVSVNEGLNEGGGTYPIFSGFLMGYLSPLLKDEFILVCDLRYYKGSLSTPMSKLDWGFEKMKELKDGETGYLNPRLFSYSQRQGQNSRYGQVFIMSRKRKLTSLILPKVPFQVHLIHGSIWDDALDLDMIGLNLMSHHRIRDDDSRDTHSPADFFRNKSKVFDLNGKSFREIIDYCNQNQLIHIGLTPWNNGNYDEVIDVLRNVSQTSIEHLTFYHLNKNDFRTLYALQKTQKKV